MAYATNRKRMTAHALRMAGRAAWLVPLRVPAGFALVPAAEPLAVDLGGPTVRLAWDELVALWGVPLGGVVVSSEVHCWAVINGNHAWPDSDQMNAWTPSPRIFSKGQSLALAAHKRGDARLFPFVKDPAYVRPQPLADDAPLPGLLKGTTADVFD